MAPYPVEEDKRLGVWFKPAGLMVEPDRLGHPNLQEVVSKRLSRTVWPIHRLDRPTSGLVLFAYQKSAVAPLMQLFEHRRVQKLYTAWLERPWEEGAVEWWDLGVKNPAAFRMEVVANEQPGALNMGLRVQPTPEPDRVKVELLTGRYHQIRAQLSAHGYPVRGDVAYGAQPWQHASCIGLHAGFLGLDDPWTNEPRQWSVEANWDRL
jgi:23S rRNA pseudouridine1911/1915/1917 synthase